MGREGRPRQREPLKSQSRHGPMLFQPQFVSGCTCNIQRGKGQKCKIRLAKCMGTELLESWVIRLRVQTNHKLLGAVKSHSTEKQDEETLDRRMWRQFVDLQQRANQGLGLDLGVICCKQRVEYKAEKSSGSDCIMVFHLYFSFLKRAVVSHIRLLALTFSYID